MDTNTQKSLNPEVLSEMMDAMEQMLEDIHSVLNDDDESDHYDNVVKAVGKFIGKCEGSYYHSGSDGFFARLGK